MPPSIDPPWSVRTPRMLLRPLSTGDRAEFVHAHRVSADFWRPWSPVAPSEETADTLFDRTLEHSQRGWAAGTHAKFAGFRADGRIAGYFSLMEIVRGVFQSAYAGWRVSADAAKQGYATEGVSAALDFAFAPPPAGLGLHRVQANIIPTNAASLRVAEKCRFRREGYALRYLQIAGQWQDHVMFAKTVEEHELLYLVG